MIAPALNQTEARRWLRTRFEGRTPEGGVFEIGGLPRGDVPDRLHRLAEQLRFTIDHEGAARDDGSGPRFESQACVAIHSALADLPRSIAANQDFWRYVSCGPLFEVIRWRYPDSQAELNYGLGDRFKCLSERLWFRSHIALEPKAEDSYALARRGTGDFWNEVLKHTFGSHRALVRALVSFQFPDAGAFDDRGRYSPQTLSKEGLRTLMRHLQHFAATTEFAALDEGVCTAMVVELAEGLPGAVGSGRETAPQMNGASQ